MRWTSWKSFFNAKTTKKFGNLNLFLCYFFLINNCNVSLLLVGICDVFILTLWIEIFMEVKILFLQSSVRFENSRSLKKKEQAAVFFDQLVGFYWDWNEFTCWKFLKKKRNVKCCPSLETYFLLYCIPNWFVNIFEESFLHVEAFLQLNVFCAFVQQREFKRPFLAYNRTKETISNKHFWCFTFDYFFLVQLKNQTLLSNGTLLHDN